MHTKCYTICIMSKTEKFVFGCIVLIAIVMRFGGLSWAPPGLYPDEAMNGNNALEALREGDFKLFYPENNGREGLFINIQAISIKLFGNTPQALRQVSALMGVLTVIGLYLLVRRLFDDWRIAALAAFFMATGFWHVNFSRIGFRAIMAPLFAVWSLYYLYKGIETNRLSNWALSGVLLGLGFHTYIAFRLMPLVVVATLIAYWWGLRRVFSHQKYQDTRRQLLGGATLMVALCIAVTLPLVVYFVQNPGDLTGRTTQVSVFTAEEPLKALGTNIAKTFAMFTVSGDYNWRHNMSGDPILLWPLGLFFALGLGRLLWKVGHALATRGHPTTVHTLLLAWMAFGIVPEVVSNEGIPHALRALPIAPAVYTTIAVGLHWIIVLMERWFMSHDGRMICIPAFMIPGSHGHARCYSRSTFLVTVAVVVFALSTGAVEAYRYFAIWAPHPETQGAFDARSVELARTLNAMPPATFKYIVVNAQGTLVRGVPMPTQTLMYLTDTFSARQQEEKNIRYLTPEEFATRKYKAGSFIVQLNP